MSVSELFDSTYVGNPNDLISQQTMGVPGYAFSRHGPVQRTPITNIIVCKPKRQPPSLSEFLEIEENDINCPYDGQRPFVTGHNRYHTHTDKPKKCFRRHAKLKGQNTQGFFYTKNSRIFGP